MSIADKFDWSAIDDSSFEELVLAIVKSKRPVRSEFRKGPGDKGRDIQVWFKNKDSIGSESEDLYFIEAKHHKAGVPPDHIAGALSWAQAEQPHALVFAVSRHLTNPCRDNVDAWKRNNPRVKVIVWERSDLENLILADADLRDLAVKLRLLPPSIHGLLPSHPERLRPSDEERIGEYSMEYRYWMTEEDIEKIDTAAEFVESLGTILGKKGLAYEYFEHVSLGVPNWSTWLRLLKAECLLQLSIRDYLFAQVSKASADEMRDRAQQISERVRFLKDTGAKSSHVD
jgi:hypothetical protein